jgi:glycosyltransferase involved in cell wall biosynthesis
MRIAIITEVFLPKIDGVVHRLLNLLRELERVGDEVLVVCPEGEGCRKCAVPVVPVRSFPFRLYPEYRIGLPGRDVVGVVRDFAPEVVHYVNPFAFGFRCYDVLERAGLAAPSVFSFHTLYAEFVKQYKLLRPLSRLLWWLTSEYHNCADVNVTVSGPMQEELARRGVPGVKLWPPAVDARLFHPAARSAEMRARLSDGRPDRKLLLTVSRLAPEKNVAFLADVLHQVPDACLAVVGDGPHRAELERRFAGLNAHFAGYLKGSRLAAAYASADAFVYASETETMGNVVLEAMACGCPVVAPRAGGIPALVEHGKTGLLYEPRCLPEAVGHTRLVLTDGPTRAGLVAAARERAEAWSWSNAAEQVRQIYSDSISQYQHERRRRTLRRRVAQATGSALVYGFKLISGKTGESAPGQPATAAAAGESRSVSPAAAPEMTTLPLTPEVADC